MLFLTSFFFFTNGSIKVQKHTYRNNFFVSRVNKKKSTEAHKHTQSEAATLYSKNKPIISRSIRENKADRFYRSRWCHHSICRYFSPASSQFVLWGFLFFNLKASSFPLPLRPQTSLDARTHDEPGGGRGEAAHQGRRGPLPFQVRTKTVFAA